jgi:hypothetical protein
MTRGSKAGGGAEAAAAKERDRGEGDRHVEVPHAGWTVWPGQWFPVAVCHLMRQWGLAPYAAAGSAWRSRIAHDSTTICIAAPIESETISGTLPRLRPYTNQIR